MASDRSIMKEVRENMGLSNTSKFPDGLIMQEIERGKEEVNRELHLRLNAGNSVNIYDTESAVDALRAFVQLRMYEHKGGKGVPKSVSEMKRANLPPAAAEQARKVQSNLRRMWD